jgi:hypothetical protein
VTGLASWSVGAHVVMGTPQGCRGEGVIENFWKLVEHFRINMFVRPGAEGVTSAIADHFDVNYTLLDIALRWSRRGLRDFRGKAGASVVAPAEDGQGSAPTIIEMSSR